MIEQLFSLGTAGMWAATATLITTALTSTGRPGATVFLLLAVPTALLEAGYWQAHHWFFPPAHTWVLCLFGLWAVFEHFFRGELYGELMEALPLDGLAALLIIWLMFIGQVALGTAPEGATVPDVALEVRRAIPVGPALVLLALTIPLQLVVGWARNRVFDVLRDLGFGGTAAILELIGVTGAVVAVVLLPAVALGAVGVIAIPVVVLALAARLVGNIVDRQRRRACPHCGHNTRGEASRCPACHGPLPIVRPLAPPAVVPVLSGARTRM
ncbi:MAG: zinc ribbon domain-containing protein [Myxococcota bacterium]